MRWASLVLIAMLGLALRMTQLGARPMHTDEAINAYIVGQTLSGKPFPYDPTDRHGPALAALTLPLVKVQGAHSFVDLTEAELRLTAVLAGVATLLLFGAAVELFDLAPCILAAAITAFAPLPVYYDRYFIHESPLAAATFALILTGWRAWRKPSVWQAIPAGVAAAVMLACKETAILHFASLAIAVVCCYRLNSRDRQLPDLPPRRVVLAAAGTFLLVSIAFYSWWGRDWQALAALGHALPHAIARAAGEGHQKPFWYYMQLLAGGWSGAVLCLLAAIGGYFAIRRSSASYRLLALYTLMLVFVYSAIPYKTPWLALDLWVPLALLAGLAGQALYRKAVARQPRRRVIPAMALASLIGAFAVARDTHERVFLHAADERNPFAYAHTGEDLLGLPAALDRLARERGIVSPRIAVIAADPWPLPWYLRKYSQTGFWQPGQEVGAADFFITSTEAAEQYQAQLHDLRPEFFEVRPGELILVWSRDVAATARE